jgi:hypothetical protein
MKYSQFLFVEQLIDALEQRIVKEDIPQDMRDISVYPATPSRIKTLATLMFFIEQSYVNKDNETFKLMYSDLPFHVKIDKIQEVTTGKDSYIKKIEKEITAKIKNGKLQDIYDNITNFFNDPKRKMPGYHIPGYKF